MPATTRISDAAKFRAEGQRIGREGMSKRVMEAVTQWRAAGETYKGAMLLAGRLKAIAAMASNDEYWREQVDKGVGIEIRRCTQGVSPPSPGGHPPSHNPQQPRGA